MRLKNYRDDLLKRLEDPHYAAEYLAQVLAEKDSAAFLIALKDVVEAGGGMGSLAGHVGLKRPSLYKILSQKGNSMLATLQEILKPLGCASPSLWTKRLKWQPRDAGTAEGLRVAAGVGIFLPVNHKLVPV